ncbi:hypothetical protein BJ085DRAFT_31749 [Dimargaris cristalligena]|uniref:Uncharacterized protein n=1 Tax=Dimargaris cristalligena TaxID=215637 RepID=A0A4Q0A0I2_9FUNG|nr:hypothetical protein BJ085DRAFT_31749 [Dimargaris cristalligena]|eukprot:RKP39494.1 hypothetical protein BJ085DRAFT_31749 [Dimargaris cristalligena]
MKSTVVSVTFCGLVLINSAIGRPNTTTLAPSIHASHLNLTPNVAFDSERFLSGTGHEYVEDRVSDTLSSNSTNDDKDQTDIVTKSALQRFEQHVNGLLQSDQKTGELIQLAHSVELESALLMRDWSLTMEDLQKSAFPKQYPIFKHGGYLSDLTSLAKLGRLHSIQSQWAYLDYSRLAPTQQRTLFPLVHALSHLPADQILRLLAGFYSGIKDQAQKLNETPNEQDDSTRSIVEELATSSTTLIDQLLVSVITALAIGGQFTVLQKMDISPLWEEGSLQHWATDIRMLIAQLVLEYGGSQFSEWAIPRAGSRRISRGVAKLLGFDRAFALLPPGRSLTGLSKDLFLNHLTAQKHIYPYRHFDDGSPALAIRVRRSTAEYQLYSTGTIAPHDAWISQDIVDDLLQSVEMTVPHWLSDRIVSEQRFDPL